MTGDRGLGGMSKSLAALTEPVGSLANQDQLAKGLQLCCHVLERMQVMEVMSGSDAGSGPQSDASKLRVDSRPLLVRLFEAGEKKQIPGPQCRPSFPRLGERVLTVDLGPSILLKSLKAGVVFTQDLPKAPAPRDFAVAEVRNNLAHIPLAGSRAVFSLLRRKLIQNAGEPLRSIFQYPDWVFSFEQLDVRQGRGCLFTHVHLDAFSL